MASDLESRVRVVVERSSSGPRDERLFLQRRTSAFAGLLATLWTIAFLYDRLETHVFHGIWFARQGMLHGLGCAISLLMWILARRGSPSTSALRLLDIGGTGALIVLLCAMLWPAPAGNRPELLLLLGATLILVVRSAIVPSTVRASAWLGAAAIASVVVTSAWIQREASKVDPLLPSGSMAAVGALLWGSIAVAGTLVVTYVTSGLREEVAKALALGQYTLGEKVGEGSMGVVFRAQHALLRRPTAVKVLAKDRATEASIRRFERESQRMAELSHPNIVPIYDFGRTADGSFYYAMELVEGLDLQRLVDDHGPQPPERVVHLLVQAAEALVEAHGAGLVHRDIKPSNLIVAQSGWRHDLVKLADFGLVTERDRGETGEGEGALVGTPTTMAPEVIRSAKNASPRSDLYALGAVAYELLCGAPVFEGSTALEICARHLHVEVVPPSARTWRPVPATLESIVLRCLAKDPEGRPASAQELVTELRSAGLSPWTAENARAWWLGRASA